MPTFRHGRRTAAPGPAGGPRLARIALLALALLAVRALPAGAQVSPGPLARAHAELEGNRACFQCHPPAGGHERMDDRCLTCHGEIAAMREARRGFHAKVVDRPCAKCHPDHGGREFQLVAFDEGTPGKFDHARAGYALEGAHAKVECRACHQPKNQRAAVVAKMKVKDHARSWLGLDTACASCHGDPHRGQLGLECARCHALAAWKPAAKFDHAATSYPLTGKHAQVECSKCHLAPAVATTLDANGRPMPQWKPLPHGECSSCHKDPHAGRFGAACAKCHVTDDFHRINNATFDHDKTRYPLRGAHVTVACAKCHDVKTAWGPKPPFARCDDCHRDAHAGQTAHAALGAGAARANSGGAKIGAGAAATGAPANSATDCAACHDLRAFSPSTFTVAAHQATKYPLAGAHARAKCSACHAKGAEASAATLGPARVPLHPIHAICTDCHADPHRGRFSAGGARPRNEGCIACHGMERFSPSRVDAPFHAGFAYSLEGAHRAVPCATCHRELESPGATSGAATLRAAAQRALAFADDRRKCAECHRSPHGDQFAARKDRGACESCHGLDAFAPATRFDHNRDAAFKLDGAHAKVRCAGCHPTVAGANGARVVVYRPLSSKCESCHAVTPARKSSFRPDAGRPARGRGDRDGTFALDSLHAEGLGHVSR